MTKLGKFYTHYHEEELKNLSFALVEKNCNVFSKYCQQCDRT